MDRYALFTLLWTNVAVPVDAASAQVVGALMAIVGPWFKMGVGAYLLIMMLIAAWSSEGDVQQRLFRKLFLAGIIYTLAATAATFDYYVTQLAHGTTNAISTAIAGAFNHGQPISANAFDIIGMRAFSVGLAVFKNLPSFSWKAIPLGILVVIYWVFSYGAIVVMFSVYLVSYVLEAFLISFGPLFIALYFFPFSRRWFDGWLASVMTTVLVQIFTAGLGAMFVFVLGLVLNLASTGLDGSQLGQVDGGIVVGELMMLVVTSLICLIFAILAGVIVFVATRIAGGAHAELGRMATPSWVPGFGGSGAANTAGANAPSASGGHANATSPSGGGAGASGTPSRQYAFNRNVGAAP